jgi:hypothetical protein
MSSVLDDDRRQDEIVPLDRPRILRGGSFIHQPEVLRSALRYWNLPTDRNINVGFRLARTLADGPAATGRDDPSASEPRRSGSR